jgi:hypothetical protein
MRPLLYLSTVLLSSLAIITSATAEQAYGEAKEAPKITLGNGEKNWSVVEDLKRDESTLTFSEVNIDGNGWLVMHPFEDGKPNGDKYIAATYLASGKSENVEIKVHKGLDSGEMFIVMMHRDLNENKVLDFVFVNDTEVMDKAVFEGSKMIAHAIPAP